MIGLLKLKINVLGPLRKLRALRGGKGSHKIISNHEDHEGHEAIATSLSLDLGCVTCPCLS